MALKKWSRKKKGVKLLWRRCCYWMAALTTQVYVACDVIKVII